MIRPLLPLIAAMAFSCGGRVTGSGGESAGSEADAGPSASAPCAGSCASPPSSGDASSPTAPSIDAGAPEDAGSSVDSASDDAGGIDSGTSACAVSGVSTTYRPASGSPGACTSNDVSSFYSECLDTAAMSCTSAATSPVSSACYACLASEATAANWGAIVLDETIWEINQGGCYAAEGSSSLACARATQFQQECENVECASDASESSLAPFQTCVAAADASECACYVASATRACAAFSSSPCTDTSTTSFEALFTAVAAAMCE